MREEELWGLIEKGLVSREELISARMMGLITVVLGKHSTRQELRELAQILLHLQWNIHPEKKGMT